MNERDTELFEKVLERREHEARRAEQSREKPLVTATAIVHSVVVYTNTDFDEPWVSQRAVNIPEGYAYFTHSHHITTELGNYRVTEPWVDRDPANQSRIIRVSIKVEAFARFFARSWIGAQLDVTMIPL